MGSCLSLEDSDDERRGRRRRRYESTGPVVINSAVVVPQYVTRSSSAPPRTNYRQSSSKAYYGEYKCQYCGRFWVSTLSWQNSYQCCKRCGRNVYPMNQREVRPTDVKREEGKNKEHAMELCQKCTQLGSYCGRSNNVHSVRSQPTRRIQPTRPIKATKQNNYYL